MTEALIIIATVAITIPFVAYFTVKLATFAYYRARHVATRYNKEKSNPLSRSSE